MSRKLYPIGIQTFERIRKEDMLYVDKTEYVYYMTHTDGKYFFLSRPRRFGKSLLTSTFRSYFEGRRDLFKGLAIERLETEWTEYPVLHFSMAGGKHMDKDQLERYLDRRLAEYEEEWGIDIPAADANDRLSALIMTAFNKTERQVVVLVDEYDAPLLDVVHEDEKLPLLRNVMRNFYSPLKDCEPYLRFVFLTGITKFSQMSIFSELNNMVNVSMRNDYAGICGITNEELESQMSADVDALAARLGMTREDTLTRLREYYDGYHFAAQSPDVYNPFSILNAMASGCLDYYWFSTGTPTYLIEMLNKYHVMPSEIGGGDADKSEFDAPTERMTTITPLLYQSGYITIKGYDPETDLYRLDIPNKEIRVGLYRSLLPNYIGMNTVKGTTTIAKMSALIRRGEIGGGDADKSEFDAPTERMTTITPLLYQSGYITIKGYDPETDLYRLDIPNKEIRVGLYRSLLPNYIGMNTVKGTTTIAKMSALIRRGDMDGALKMLQAYLATVPYCSNADSEGHYQQMMYVIFSILDNYVDVEVRTPHGRVDMVLRTATHIYLFELKLNRDAATAMRQIDLKEYPQRFMLSGLPVVNVGINFDVERHNITDWEVRDAGTAAQ